VEMNARHVKYMLWFLDAIFNSPEARATRFLRKVKRASEVIRPSNAQFAGGCQAGRRCQISEDMHEIRMHKPIDAPLLVLAPGEIPPPLSMDDIETYREEGITLKGKRRFKRQ